MTNNIDRTEAVVDGEAVVLQQPEPVTTDDLLGRKWGREPRPDGIVAYANARYERDEARRAFLGVLGGRQEQVKGRVFGDLKNPEKKILFERLAKQHGAVVCRRDRDGKILRGKLEKVFDLLRVRDVMIDIDLLDGSGFYTFNASCFEFWIESVAEQE